ncbi:MAG TPA: hypothetical protein VKA86_02985 [Candidatus Krumholzibacteria bacterium]|nr:hypothetical protein [Candidatus Krumholzibacteria bacterium]
MSAESNARHSLKRPRASTPLPRPRLRHRNETYRPPDRILAARERVAALRAQFDRTTDPAVRRGCHALDETLDRLEATLRARA